MFYKILEIYAEMLERRKDPAFGGKPATTENNEASAGNLSSSEKNV